MKRKFSPTFSLPKPSVQHLTYMHRRRARNPKLNNKLEWFLVIQYHFLISAAMVLIIIGIIRLENGTDLSPSDSIYLKVGFAVIVICWAVLMTWALLSLRQRPADATTYVHGTQVSISGILFLQP
jgi:hypothetical protein